MWGSLALLASGVPGVHGRGARDTGCCYETIACAGSAWGVASADWGVFGWVLVVSWGAGASVGPRYPGKDAPEAEMRLWREEHERAVAEYSLWVDCDSATYRVGWPGFFSRYADCVDSNWVKYYASDAARLLVGSFDACDAGMGWFEGPPEMPGDICLIARDIDGAYWDLFFRDEWAYEAVKGYLGDRGREFVEVA